MFAGVGDSLAAWPAASWSLEIQGPHAEGLDAGPANLVVRAAAALAAWATARGHAVPPARLELTKNLPVASGIGGGSADAAATLRLLRRLWRLPDDGWATDGRVIAGGLGADVPVCLDATPARMRGIGDRLTPAPRLPRFGLALVNPGVAISTAAVFAARDPAVPSAPPPDLPTSWPDAAAMAATLATCRNDLEAPALRLAPAIGACLRALRDTEGCRLARMSGSGATCFGLFDEPAAAERAAASAARPGWWCWGGAPAGLAATDGAAIAAPIRPC